MLHTALLLYTKYQPYYIQRKCIIIDSARDIKKGWTKHGSSIHKRGSS